MDSAPNKDDRRRIRYALFGFFLVMTAALVWSLPADALSITGNQSEKLFVAYRRRHAAVSHMGEWG